MVARKPHYEESKSLDREIRDQLDNICKLSISLQTLYFHGASSATLTSAAQDIENSLVEIRAKIVKYDEVENVE